MSEVKPARTRAFQQNGRPAFASDGAVNQDGTLPICVCNTCGAHVVWATSRKTGRKYLVNVRRGQKDQRFYMKHDLHDCAKVQAAAEAFAAWEASS